MTEAEDGKVCLRLDRVEWAVFEKMVAGSVIRPQWIPYLGKRTGLTTSDSRACDSGNECSSSVSMSLAFWIEGSHDRFSVILQFTAELSWSILARCLTTTATTTDRSNSTNSVSDLCLSSMSFRSSLPRCCDLTFDSMNGITHPPLPQCVPTASSNSTGQEDSSRMLPHCG